jgi:hypothetical protein
MALLELVQDFPSYQKPIKRNSEEQLKLSSKKLAVRMLKKFLTTHKERFSKHELVQLDMNKDGESEDEISAVVITSHIHTFTSFQTQRSGNSILGKNCPGCEIIFFSVT